MIRLRIHYSKQQALRYTSNLDMHKIWERTLRRARLPLAYSQGFHPQPKLNQACPLPLGILSQAEMIDIWLEEELSPQTVLDMLGWALPDGLVISSIQPVDLRETPIPVQVIESEYRVEFLEPISAFDLANGIEKLLTEPTLPRQWRNKAYDLRPLIHQLFILPAQEGAEPQLFMSLSAREGATGRPEEVLSALGFDPFSVRIERTHLVLAGKS